jgi:hypothetical protein
MMDCDQVFMILTRGPFPAGDPWDDQVEDHLEICGECWQLAEALRPAVEVFQEAVPPAEGRDLPGYWGDARPASAAVGQLQRTAARTAARTAPATDVRQASQPYYGHQLPPLSAGFPVDLIRAALVASALTATAVGIALLWRVW